MQTVIGCLTKRLQKLCVHCCVSEDYMSLNELSLYIQQLSSCRHAHEHTHTHMNCLIVVYLIKLWVQSLFYNRCFVLGFLVNVWLEVPETEECDTITQEWVIIIHKS